MEDPYETVLELPTEEDAAIAAGRLRAEGFDCRVESRRFRAEPVTFGALGTLELRVPRDQVEAARKLLAEFERSEGLWEPEAD